MGPIHFIGIGGVGMNGLAQLAARSGFNVSGSDRAYDPESELFQSLEQLGIRIVPQDGSGISGKTTQVVFSTAIEPGNPDLLAAQNHSLPLLHRSEFLKQLVGSSELIAVAGTAGKTTTTGLLGWIFECMGQDPSVYNGAAVLNWKKNGSPGNARSGSSGRWIIEADESDKSFLNFRPTHAIITNISRDHYELDELQRMFDRFSSQTRGTVIDGSSMPVHTVKPDAFVFKEIEFKVPLIGQHNLENAFCAVRLCAALGMDLERVRDALARFEGIERRLEISGTADGVTVIDDYAHNAAKISAALAAVSARFSRVHAFWRPHGFTPLFQGMDDLTEAFAKHGSTNPGSIFILPVFYAGGSVDRKATSEDLVRRLNSAGIPASYVPDYATLKHTLEQEAQPGDALLGMGARDPELPLFAKKLVHEWKQS